MYRGAGHICNYCKRGEDVSEAYININDVDKRLKKISDALGEFKDSAPKVLKSAINDTARKSRKLLAAEAQQQYTVKNAGFNKAMEIKNATVANLTAKIQAKGKPRMLSEFKVSPATMKAKKPAVTKAKVIKSNSLKPLEKDGIKAFITKFASGKTAVAQRVGQERLPIKALYSMSVPKMLGNEKAVMRKIRPEIYKILDEQTEIQIQKYLKRLKKKAESGG